MDAVLYGFAQELKKLGTAKCLLPSGSAVLLPPRKNVLITNLNIQPTWCHQTTRCPGATKSCVQLTLACVVYCRPLSPILLQGNIVFLLYAAVRPVRERLNF